MSTSKNTCTVGLVVAEPALRRRAEWALECLLTPLDLGWRVVDAAPADATTIATALPDIGYGCPGSRLTLEHDPAAWQFTRGAPAGDLLARVFWFLARVEEQLADDQRDADAFDEHGRFRAAASVLCDAAPDDAPVDHHVRAIAAQLGVGLAPWPHGHQFAVALTHDIDLPLQWNRQGVRRTLRTARADLRRGRAGAALRGTWAALTGPLHRTDPFRNAPAIGAAEAALGARSTSYLIAGHHAPADGDGASYDAVRAEVAREVVAAGGVAGLHGSYTSSVTPGRLAAERARLEAELAARDDGDDDGDGDPGPGDPGPAVVDHRFHYLRHLPHRAWSELDAAGFRTDASLGFAERPGFRSGSSHPYRAWSHAEDRPLDLIVVPLALMDATLEPRYLDRLTDGAAIFAQLTDHATSNGSAFSLLWHNDKLVAGHRPGTDAARWNDLYWQLLRDAAAAGAWLTDTGSVADHWRTRLARAPRA